MTQIKKNKINIKRAYSLDSFSKYHWST